MLERKGARCGLITTAGFGDVLELARRTRPHLFGLTGEFIALIPRELRMEVKERTDADGEILTPLDEVQRGQDRVWVRTFRAVELRRLNYGPSVAPLILEYRRFVK